jgi:hypothetical protein
MSSAECKMFKFNDGTNIDKNNIYILIFFHFF